MLKEGDEAPDFTLQDESGRIEKVCRNVRVDGHTDTLLAHLTA